MPLAEDLGWCSEDFRACHRSRPRRFRVLSLSILFGSGRLADTVVSSHRSLVFRLVLADDAVSRLCNFLQISSLVPGVLARGDFVSDFSPIAPYSFDSFILSTSWRCAEKSRKLRNRSILRQRLESAHRPGGGEIDRRRPGVARRGCRNGHPEESFGRP